MTVIVGDIDVHVHPFRC